MILCQDAIRHNRIKPKVCETSTWSNIVVRSQVNFHKLYCEKDAECRKVQQMERKRNIPPKDCSAIDFVKTVEVYQRGVYESIRK
jgi:hypothetical protein